MCGDWCVITERVTGAPTQISLSVYRQIKSECRKCLILLSLLSAAPMIPWAPVQPYWCKIIPDPLAQLPGWRCQYMSKLTCCSIKPGSIVKLQVKTKSYIHHLTFMLSLNASNSLGCIWAQQDIAYVWSAVSGWNSLYYSESPSGWMAGWLNARQNCFDKLFPLIEVWPLKRLTRIHIWLSSVIGLSWDTLSPSFQESEVFFV